MHQGQGWPNSKLALKDMVMAFGRACRTYTVADTPQGRRIHPLPAVRCYAALFTPGFPCRSMHTLMHGRGRAGLSVPGCGLKAGMKPLRWEEVPFPSVAGFGLVGYGH